MVNEHAKTQNAHRDKPEHLGIPGYFAAVFSFDSKLKWASSKHS